MFSTIVSPRFGDIDGLGHVNNTVLPVWFVRTEFDFLRQMYFRSDVEIRTFITKIGNSSFTVGHEAWQDGELKDRGQAVLVYYDFKLQKAIPLPDSIRDTLKAHMLPAMDTTEMDTDSPCSI